MRFISVITFSTALRTSVEAFFGQSALSFCTLRLVRLVGMMQVRSPFATAAVDTLDQT